MPRSPPGHDADTGLVILAPALCAALVTVLASLAPAGCAGCGHRSGSSRQHPVRRRAPAPTPLSALARLLLRSAPALRSAPRRALLSAPVRTAPPPPPAACCARLPAAPAAPPATHSPWRLPSAGFAGVNSPFALPRIRGFLDAGRRFGFTPHASLMQACHRAPCPVLARSSGAERGRAVVGASELRAQLANRHRPVIGWPRLSASAVRTDLSGVRSVFRACCAPPAPPSPPVTDRSARAVREIARTPPFRGERCAQSGASSRSDSSNARASPTSFSSSSPRPSRSIAPRFSVARNQV